MEGPAKKGLKLQLNFPGLWDTGVNLWDGNSISDSGRAGAGS
jgi:hypothetical protein